MKNFKLYMQLTFVALLIFLLDSTVLSHEPLDHICPPNKYFYMLTLFGNFKHSNANSPTLMIFESFLITVKRATKPQWTWLCNWEIRDIGYAELIHEEPPSPSVFSKGNPHFMANLVNFFYEWKVVRPKIETIPLNGHGLVSYLSSNSLISY